MNKKTLIVVIIVLVIAFLAVAGVMLFKYSKNLASQNEEQTDIIDNPIDLSGIEVEGGEPSGLIICQDNCGDGICQKPNEPCENNDRLNCSCAETPQDCPQDCK